VEENQTGVSWSPVSAAKPGLAACTWWNIAPIEPK
jgi:hypothetical protein